MKSVSSPYSGLDANHAQDFQIFTQSQTSPCHGCPAGMTSYRSSSICVRFFCSTCGSQVFIRYDNVIHNGVEDTHGDSEATLSPWAGEVHFPTSLLDAESVLLLEEVNLFHKVSII